MTQQPTYRFFNTGDGWPGLSVDGVVVASGSLTLPIVPGVNVATPPCVPIATEANGPRGYRYVTHHDDGTITVVEPSSDQLVATWGPFAKPSLIVADASSVFVVESGSSKITRLDADGVLDESWWNAMAQWSGPIEVVAISLVNFGDETRLVVLAEGGDTSTRVLVADLSGAKDESRMSLWNDLVERWRDARTGSWQIRPRPFLTGLAIDVLNDRLLVAADGDLLCFDVEGHWVGRAETPLGWRSVLIYVVPDPYHTSRYVVTGATPDVALVLNPGSAWTRVGSFVCGPVSSPAAESVWCELRSRLVVPEGCRLRLWTLGREIEEHPDPDSLPGDLAAPTTLDWRPVHGDPAAALVGSEPSRYLWLGGVLTGDGTASPTLDQVRVDIGTSSWLSHLPAIYAEPGPSADFLDRALRWLQSELRDAEELLAALPERLDAGAADDAGVGSARTALDELADWLGVTLDEQWPQSRRRAVTAEAYRLHAIRGTAEGLSRLLSLFLDAPIEVLDPAYAGSFWVLEDDSGAEPAALGLSTMLSATAPEGAVLGSTAIPGHSTLSDGTEYGAPLFADTAHRFCVQAHAVVLPKQAERDAVRRLIEKEKPAHLTYHLCLIDATARVGFQSRVGIDAIVAGPPAEMVLSGSAESGAARGLGTGSTLSAPDTSPTNDPGRHLHVGTAVLGTGLHLT